MSEIKQTIIKLEKSSTYGNFMANSYSFIPDLKRIFTKLKFLLICSIVVGLSSCKQASEHTNLKLAHSLDTQHPVHKAIEFMAARVKELSNGQLTVDIYPSGQLGSERQLMELLQIGSLAMTKVSSSPMEGFVPQIKIFSLPYVFRDKEHYYKVLDSQIGKSLLLAGENVRLRGLGYYDAGSRSFYTVNKPINKPADLEGQKIRVQQSPTALQLVRAMGGSPTPIAWAELYTALQQGVVDGAENNPPSYYSSKHYEVAPYFSINEHTMVPDMLLISRYIWQKLSPQEQAWLQQAVDESVVFQRELWREATQEALRAVQDAGVEVIYPDKTPFKQKVKRMHSALQGSEVFNLYQQIQTM